MIYSLAVQTGKKTPPALFPTLRVQTKVSTRRGVERKDKIVQCRLMITIPANSRMFHRNSPLQKGRYGHSYLCLVVMTERVESMFSGNP